MTMTGKKIVCGNELLSLICGVCDEVALVAGSTMGPFGHTVILGRDYGSAKPTKDGVTAVKHLKYSCSSKQAILSFLQEAANTVNQLAGDGTTTVTMFTCRLLKICTAHMATGDRSASLKAVQMKRGVVAARSAILEYLKGVARPVSKKQEMYNVAEISSNGDQDIAEILADIIEKVGRNGVITIDEGKTLKKVDYELTTGMSFTQGYISSYFTTNSEKMIAELDNPYIFLINKKLSSTAQILPVLESVAQSGRSLLIIAEDVDGEALATLVVNKMRGGLKVCAVKAPGFGERRVEMLNDIAILSGGQLVVDEMGVKPENISVDMLGSAKRVTVYKDKTVVVGGSGSKADIDARVAQIKNALEESTSEYDQEKLRERIARLIGGVAVIKVGGATEAEVKERKDRYEDALNATKAAVEEGIVPGGGTTLYNARKVLAKIKMANDAEQAGVNIVIESLSVCMDRILANAGYNGAVIASKLDEMNDPNMIFNARSGAFANAFDAGIIDPAKVVRVAAETALDTAELIIGSYAMIVDEKKDEEGSGGRRGGDAHGGGAGGYGDMDF